MGLYDKTDLNNSISIKGKNWIIHYPKVTRVEVIDHSAVGPSGRVYINWKPNIKVELSFQDDDRILKIFISEKE